MPAPWFRSRLPWHGIIGPVVRYSPPIMLGTGIHLGDRNPSFLQSFHVDISQPLLQVLTTSFSPPHLDLGLAPTPKINQRRVKPSPSSPAQKEGANLNSCGEGDSGSDIFQTTQVPSFTIPSRYQTSTAVVGSSGLTALTYRTVKVDISHLLRASDSNESSPTAAEQPRSTAATISPSSTTASAVPPYAAPTTSGTGGKRSMPPHPSETPAKKQSKWSADEDALIIQLRGDGMKWEDISQRLPGRSAISCRLHYQNYLERRCDWSDEKKSKLARLYERFKPDMWQKVAEEMGVPWRAAEAMHWQLGEVEMARRAGVVPFSMSSVTMDAASSGHVRPSSHRGHAHSHSTTSGSNLASAAPSPRYHREGPATRALAARRDTLTRSSLTASPTANYGYERLDPSVTMSGPPTSLPSVAEMTTGVSPYNTPAYSLATPWTSYHASSPGPYLPSISYPPRSMHSNNEGKRTRSPEKEYRETSRRRQER